MSTNYLSPSIGQPRVRGAPQPRQVEPADSATLNNGQVRRVIQFNRLTAEEQSSIIERVRCLARAGVSPAMTIRQTAQETGRKAETVRYTLRRFTLAHPDLAIFPYHDGLLPADVKRDICQRHRRGESVETLARRFAQPKTGIRHVLREMRAARIMALPLDYIGNEQFASLRLREEAEILAPLPESDTPAKKPRAPSGLPPYLASLYDTPLLASGQEAHLFRKMNYLTYKASVLRGQLDVMRPKSRLMDRIDKLYDESLVIRNQLIRANLRLVVSIAKRHMGPASDFFELVSDGNMSLLRAVAKFDFARGNKFSTYATWAIRKNFARTISETFRQRDRFSTSCPETLGVIEDTRLHHAGQELAQVQQQAWVEGLLDRLDGREREIVTRRFGLIYGQEPLKLMEVGTVLGITKERVRQIQSRAMSKLRKAAEEDHIEHLA